MFARSHFLVMSRLCSCLGGDQARHFCLCLCGHGIVKRPVIIQVTDLYLAPLYFIFFAHDNKCASFVRFFKLLDVLCVTSFGLAWLFLFAQFVV